MAKVIFVLQRRAGLTREQALAQWNGEQHAAIVGKLPGLTRYVQNHVGPASAGPVCDGIGELWFATDDLMNEALNSPEMAAAKCSESQLLAVPGTPKSSRARSVARVAMAISTRRALPMYLGLTSKPESSRPPST